MNIPQDCSKCHITLDDKNDSGLAGTVAPLCWTCFASAVDELTAYIAAAPNAREAGRRYAAGVVPLGESPSDAKKFIRS